MAATVAELAKLLRLKLVAEYGEAGYAKLLLDFDRRMGHDELWVRGYLEEHEPDEAWHRLAVCWLDGKGFGNEDYFD